MPNVVRARWAVCGLATLAGVALLLPLDAVATDPPPGALDASFGTGGLVTGPVPSTLALDGVLRQSDGHLVVVGTLGSGTSGTASPYSFGLSRLNADGSLDTTFGVGGTVSTPLGDGGAAYALAAAIEGDGSVLVGGMVLDGGVTHGDVVHYSADGVLDSSFGNAGIAELNLGGGGFVDAIAIDGSRNIVVSGGTVTATRKWALGRFHADGTPDTTFGTNGVVVTSLDANGGYELTVGGDGSITATNGSVLARFTSDGAADPTFGVGGIASVDFGGGPGTAGVFAVAPGPSGSVLVAGGSSNGLVRSFAIARYDSAGSLDASFGTSGVTVTTLGGATDSVAWDLTTDPLGRILVVGQRDTDLALVRLTPTGQLDSSFATGGVALQTFGQPIYPAAAVVQPDGNIVVAAGANNLTPLAPWLGARYVGSPVLVPGAPTGVAASAADASAVLTWAAPASDGGTPITAYTATSSPDGRTCSTSGTLGCTVTGLANGTAYTFTVSATNAVGTGPASAASNSITPVAVPGAPTGVAGTPSGGSVGVMWAAPASTGGTPITGYVVTALPGARTCSTTGSLGCSVTGLADGLYAFTVTATNAAGTGPASASSPPVRVDTMPPTVSAPTAAFQAGQVIGSSVPVTLTWAGGDSGSGIDHYDVWLSTNGGAYALVGTTTAPTYTRSLGPSSTTTYRFAVRAFDKSGNASNYAYGVTFHVLLVQQSSTAVRFYGAWYSRSFGQASGGSFRYTSSKGAYATYTFVGRAVSLVGYETTNVGSFKVYLDGAYIGTVSEYATSLQWRRLVFSRLWSSSHTHTIKLVCVGTSGRPRIDLDAFVVLR